MQTSPTPTGDTQPVLPVQSLGLTVTERAQKKITTERHKRQQPDLLFRVAVLGGGCSGLQYQMGYNAVEPADGDQVFPADDAFVICDDVSMRFLAGATLDYEQDLMGSRFAIKNPNAQSGCGCGVSFSVDFGKINL